MELVHGLPLSKVMRRARERGLRTLPPPLALMVAIEICKGLHYAHTRLDDRGAPLNIVHRDVSPQNVLVSYEGQVKLVDFGIAKARNAGQVETQAGSVKGKYVYFAPEQARGKPLDGRTDVFAAGIVLYEMLCGRMPFEGKMVDVLAKIVRGQFPRPRVLNPELPIELEQIVLQAMATDREQRYPSAQAMQEALAAKLYANAPTFSTHELAQLMHWLFESELLAEGLTVEHAPEFLDWIEGFKDGTHPGALFGPGGRPAPAPPPLPAASTPKHEPEARVVEAEVAARGRSARGDGPRRGARVRARPALPRRALGDERARRRLALDRRPEGALDDAAAGERAARREPPPRAHRARVPALARRAHPRRRTAAHLRGPARGRGAPRGPARAPPPPGRARARRARGQGRGARGAAARGRDRPLPRPALAARAARRARRGSGSTRRRRTRSRRAAR